MAVSGLAATVMWALAFVFAISAAAKLANVDQATRAVRSFVGERAVPRLAGALLAGGEIGLALGLATAAGWNAEWRRLVASVAALVLWTFAAGLTVHWMRGARFSCGCFGASSTNIGLPAIARTTVLAALATWLAAAGGAARGDPVRHGLVAALVTTTALTLGAAVTALRSQPAVPVQDAPA